jgi:acetylornithine deacetylase
VGGTVTDLVEVLDALVSMPTVAGQPNRMLVDYVATRLQGCGVECEVIPSYERPDGLNMYACIGPADEPGGVLLAAHTDVVPVEGQDWHSDPFQLTRVGELLYGRGTSDMKSFVAAAVCAAEAAAQRDLRRPLRIAFSTDEELGCAGVASLLDVLDGVAGAPALCVVGEPTRMRIADRHKGKVRLRVDVRGRAVHSAAAPTGVNAVTYAARLVAALDELARGLATVGAEPAFTVPHATLSVGPIRGGLSTNIVPDDCRFEFELRYLPGQDPDATLAGVKDAIETLQTEMQAIAPEAGIDLFELAAYPPLASTGDSTVLLASIPPFAELVGTETGASLAAVDFGTEAGLYQQRLRVPTFVCGPGDMARAHRADEYIELDELAAVNRFLTGLVDWLCQD